MHIFHFNTKLLSFDQFFALLYPTINGIPLLTHIVASNSLEPMALNKGLWSGYLVHELNNTFDFRKSALKKRGDRYFLDILSGEGRCVSVILPTDFYKKISFIWFCMKTGQKLHCWYDNLNFSVKYLHIRNSCKIVILNACYDTESRSKKACVNKWIEQLIKWWIDFF